MRTYGDVMREVTERSVSAWPIGRPFPLMRETQAITLEVIVRTVFGVTDVVAMEALSDRLRRFITQAVNPIYLWPLLQVDLGPLSPLGRFVRLRREIDGLLDAEIANRRATGDADREDVLSLLLAARDEHGAPMGDAEIRDQLMTLLLAGHETTATSLAWTVHRILSEPGVYERARAEALAAGGGVTAENVGQLEYLDAVAPLSRHGLHPLRNEGGAGHAAGERRAGARTRLPRARRAPQHHVGAVRGHAGRGHAAGGLTVARGRSASASTVTSAASIPGQSPSRV